MTDSPIENTSTVEHPRRQGRHSLAELRAARGGILSKLSAKASTKKVAANSLESRVGLARKRTQAGELNPPTTQKPEIEETDPKTIPKTEIAPDGVVDIWEPVRVRAVVTFIVVALLCTWVIIGLFTGNVLLLVSAGLLRYPVRKIMEHYFGKDDPPSKKTGRSKSRTRRQQK